MTARNEIPGTHQVVVGDTLFSLAEKYQTTVSQLKILNGLQNNTIQTGRVLIVRDGLHELGEKILALGNAIQNRRTRDEIDTLKKEIESLKESLKQRSDIIAENVVRALLRERSAPLRTVDIGQFFLMYFSGRFNDRKEPNIFSPETKGRIMLRLAQEQMLADEPFRYFGDIEGCSVLKDVLITAARPRNPYYHGGSDAQVISNAPFIFEYFDKYKSNDWAVDVLIETLKFENETIFNQLYDRYGLDTKLSEQDKQKIAEAKNKYKGWRRTAAKFLGITGSIENLGREETIKLHGIMRDEALENLFRIQDNDLKNAISITIEAITRSGDTFPYQFGGSSSQLFENLRFLVARNLFFSGITGDRVNINTINTEVMKILMLWKSLQKIHIFNGRNILFAAHEEQESSGYRSFGRTIYLNSIEQQGGRFIRNGNRIAGRESRLFRPVPGDRESREKIKQSIVTNFIYAQRPFTFIFDGHGSPNAIHLSSAENSWDSITCEELFGIYKQRQECLRGKTVEFKDRDIFINDGCYSSNFIRKFLSLCAMNKVDAPIFIGSAEFGQVSYYHRINPYKDKLLRELCFDNGNPRTNLNPVTYGNLIQKNSEAEYKYSLYMLLDWSLLQGF